MITVDKKKAESLLRSAVRKRGRDTVVKGNNCVYQKNGAPVCMVGEVIGFVSDQPLDKVFSGNSLNGLYALNATRFESIRSDIEEKAGVRFTDGAANLLIEAQDGQDSQLPWGTVLDRVVRKR